MPQRNLTVIILAAIVSTACYSKAERNRYAAVFSDALDQISGQYVEEVDQRELFDAAMVGMVGELDEYSNYINPEEYRQFQISIEQKFGGIGIEVTLDSKTNELVVVSPLVGTPAYYAGMRAGDRIVEIEGESTRRKGFSLSDAVAKLRGEPGTTVNLKVLHEHEKEPVAMSIERANIRVDSVLGDTRRENDSWNYFLDENPRIGYVRVTTFAQHTVEELSKALRFRDQPVDALIFDLRGNPGGLLEAAIETCDMFLDKGSIVSTRGRGAKVRDEYFAHRSKTIVDRDIPIVVLVNNGSASASEIVAACLQDHGRAVVIGERTWGKGTVQNVIELEGGNSVLKLTTASYWRPSGKNIHRGKDADEDDDWGVRPNDGFEVKLSKEEIEQMVLSRRRRDVVHPDDPPRPATEPDTGDDNGKNSPFDDPQLRRAIEHLEGKLKGLKSTT